MTNFNNSLMNPEFTDTPLFQHDGMGYERWDVLAKNYDMATSAEGTANLMSLVWYSNTYTKPMDSEDFFFTEYAVDSISAETLYKRGNEMWADEWFRNQVSDKKKEWDDKSLWHIPSTPLWYTTHTCVYDLAKKELSIKVHEGFDGMDKFHTVSFDTHFNKPYNTKH